MVRFGYKVSAAQKRYFSSEFPSDVDGRVRYVFVSLVRVVHRDGAVW